ncbi:MAG TPA: hypothetical protein VJT32_00365 [bacterium]|nr:hypothetical protein [bacterium]
MRKLVAMTLGILTATLTMAGVGQAQSTPAIQGTIQAVDCQTNALVMDAADGTHVVPAGPYTTAFVDSAPVSFCTLRQYVGDNAAVTVAPGANQLVAERVDVYTAAVPTSTPAPASAISGMPAWAEIALGTVIVGGLLYLAIRGSQTASQNQSSQWCYDNPGGPVCRDGGDRNH